jgi:type IV secretory pathway TrbF-like protein
MKSLLKKREIAFTYHRHYLSAQKKWSEKMSSLAEGCSKRKLIFLLSLFVILSAGYLLYNIYNAFSDKEVQQVKISEQTVKIKIID